MLFTNFVSSRSALLADKNMLKSYWSLLAPRGRMAFTENSNPVENEFHLESLQCWGLVCRRPWMQRPLRRGPLCAWPENQCAISKTCTWQNHHPERKADMVSSLWAEELSPDSFFTTMSVCPDCLKNSFSQDSMLHKFNGQIIWNTLSSESKSYQPCPSDAFFGRKPVEIEMLQCREFVCENWFLEQVGREWSDNAPESFHQWQQEAEENLSPCSSIWTLRINSNWYGDHVKSVNWSKYNWY